MLLGPHKFPCNCTVYTSHISCRSRSEVEFYKKKKTETTKIQSNHFEVCCCKNYFTRVIDTILTVSSRSTFHNALKVLTNFMHSQNNETNFSSINCLRLTKHISAGRSYCHSRNDFYFETAFI